MLNPARTLLLVFTLPAAAADVPFVHHPDITLSLYAREPDIVDPVALCFAADGSCYVVEMRDYPYGFGPERKPGGTVRWLADTNGDGAADQSVLFAEGLSFPTSITPWRNGVLVAAPPDIIFLADTDGDHRADVRETILTGFVLAVTDSNFNGLRHGLDHRIHGVNGGNGGDIRRPGGPLSGRLGNRDFSFDPATGDVRTTFDTGGGFGLAFDAWGHSFTPHNVNYLQQRILPAAIADRAPSLGPFTASIAPSENVRIYAAVEAATRPNHPEQAGWFSSAGATGIMDSDLFGAELARAIFTCDPASGIVHRDDLSENGPVFAARRAPGEAAGEFIAGRDPWFRPAGIEQGPDGALYLIDMHRAVIEHPDYIPPRLREKSDIRAGDDKGRIWRVAPRTGLPPQPRLAGADAAALAKALASGAPWVRGTAQRLLFENELPARASAVRAEALNHADPRARVRALWLLDALGALTTEDLPRALADPAPGVRENAVQLTAARAASWKEASALLIVATRDNHARVRFQAALSLSNVSHPDKSSALLAMLEKDAAHVWSVKAILAAALPESLLPPALRRDSLRANDDFIHRMAVLACESKAPLDWLDTLPPENLMPALLRGLQAAKPGSAWSKRLDLWEKSAAPGLRLPLLELSLALQHPPPPVLRDTLTAALDRLRNKDAPEPERLAAIALLGLDREASSLDHLWPLFNAQESDAIQLAALAALSRRRPENAAAELLRRWRQLRPAVWPAAASLLVNHRGYHAPLVAAMERGELHFGEINLDLEQRRAILRSPDKALAARAGKFFSDDEYSNRRAVVDEWLAKLPSAGDSAKGRDVFNALCMTCHRRGDTGFAVGPDLMAQAHRSTEDLLGHILDPNMALNPQYTAWSIETTGGEIKTGLLKQDAGPAVTLLLQGGVSITVPRHEIKKMETLSRSLMPEGLEATLSPADMKSLIVFLQSDAPGK